MLMNADENEEVTERHAKSPLKNDDSGRFSRKGKIKNNILKYYPLFDSIFIVFFSSFLLITDLILFAGSGNIEVFKDSVFPIPEVILISSAFFAIIWFIVTLSHNHKTIKSIIAGFFAFLFVFIIHKQFSQLDSNIEVGIGVDSVSKSVALGLVVGFLAFWVYYKKSILYKIFLTLVPIVLFFNVCSNLDKKSVKEFITFTDSENTDTYGTDQRLVYIILPNFINHNQFKEWNTPEAQKTYELISDFYKYNKFKVFNKAFVEVYDYFDNLIMFLNPKARKNNLKNYKLQTRLLSGNWKFSNLIHNNINLKNNELYDYLSYQGYNISAYKSRSIDLCRKNHQLNVQRCVEKVNLPTNIYDMNLSIMSRTSVLFMEWFFSLKLNKHVLPVFEYVSRGLLMDNAPQISVIYNNLYVVNSIKFFDMLYDNIKEDSGKQAYFVFADIPSDMYIYDEFCQIKPKNEWMDRANLPWVDKDYSKERKAAYLQQYRCLYGKMQQFIDKLATDNLLYSTKIIFAGASNVNDFQVVLSDDYSRRFIDNNLVSMAIYNGLDEKYEIDEEICPLRDIMTKELFGIGKCGSIDNIHAQARQSVITMLDDLSGEQTDENSVDFNQWYEQWKLHNAQ